MEDYAEKQLDKNYCLADILCEFDTLLYDEEQDHIHYMELKNSKTNWEEAMSDQIIPAANLLNSMEYKFSASRIAWKKNDYEHLTREEIDEKLSSLISGESVDNPVDLECAITSINPAPPEENQISLPINYEKYKEMVIKRREKRKEEETSIIDRDPPHKTYHKHFHTHEQVDVDLEDRFDEAPERDYVNVAYIPNRSIDWIRNIQETSPENYSKLEKAPPENLDEIMEKMNIVYYSNWSDNIKRELTQEELEKLEDTFIVVKQSVEDIFDEEIL